MDIKHDSHEYNAYIACIIKSNLKYYSNVQNSMYITFFLYDTSLLTLLSTYFCLGVDTIVYEYTLTHYNVEVKMQYMSHVIQYNSLIYYEISSIIISCKELQLSVKYHTLYDYVSWNDYSPNNILHFSSGCEKYSLQYNILCLFNKFIETHDNLTNTYLKNKYEDEMYIYYIGDSDMEDYANYDSESQEFSVGYSIHSYPKNWHTKILIQDNCKMKIIIEIVKTILDFWRHFI